MRTELYKGFHVRNANDLAIVDAIYERDDYAVREVIAYELAKYRFDGVPLAVDCGAHIGTFSRRFLEEVPSAVVVAIEDDLEDCDLLCQNIPSACCVRGRAVGTWEQEGDYEIGSLLKLAPREATPVALKLDVEGYEFDILRDTPADFLERFLVIVGEYHGGEGTGLGSGLGSASRYVGAPGNRDHFFRLVRERLPGFLAFEARELSHFLLYNITWKHRCQQ